MKLAFTISSYRLHAFVRLGICQLARLSPDSPILVSDDPSPESSEIVNIAKELGVVYRGARQRRGHFGGDYQSLVNSLAFAEAAGADVAVKVSQRFIFRKPESIQAICTAFEDPNIAVVTPGQPKARTAFAHFTTLSDVVAIRVGCIKADELLYMYRQRLLTEHVPWASFIECTVDMLHHTKFPGRTRKLEELTNPTPDPIYLRRYQANEQQYRDLAVSHGFAGVFKLDEWGKLEQGNYLCRPVVV